MKLKKVIGLPDAAATGRNVFVYFKPSTGEYVCQLFISGGHYEPADYFTDDYDDAIGTAKAMCQTAAQSIMAMFNTLKLTSADRIERLCVECTPVECGDILHWTFTDGSMLYYNSHADRFSL